jgi:diguanylate cyclase (GGDEF)-like protein
MRSLRSQILLLSLGIVVVTSATILVAFWFNTHQYSRDQVDEMMANATATFRQLLATREEQLINSAQLLTSDFGFKQAVASRDNPTIASVLSNHSARVEADLMFMTDLSGMVQASTHDGLKTQQPFPYESLIKTAAAGGGTVSFIRLDKELFQIVIIPVRAPVPIAFTGIGFKLDIEIAEELKALTNIEVSFLIDEADEDAVVSTLQGRELAAGLAATEDITNSFGLYMFSESSYISHYVNLEAEDTNLVPAVLSINLYDASTGFRQFRNEILLITVGIFALATLGALFLARNMSRPLQKLAGVAEQISEGQYQLELDNRSETAEVKSLYKAFSQMSDRISEREQRIRYQAEHDSLTDLFNRETLLEKLNARLASDPETKLTVISLKIQNYRSIDDSFGPDVSDGVLVSVAKRMQGYERSAHGRVGSDEFVSVLLTKPNAEKESVESFLAFIGKNLAINEFVFNLQIVAGFAQFPVQGRKAEELLRRATIAMEKAMQRQLPLTAYQDGDDEEHLKRIKTIADLRAALGQPGQLSMHYQPKLNLGNNKIEKMEALIRWIHPEDGFISPEYFIALAEQSSMINEVTDWVISAVIEQIVQWHPRYPNLQVAINISARDLEREELLDYTLRLLKVHALPASCICFEMTERDMMSNADRIERQMHRLTDAGFELSIDDYGIGESSLSRLRRMPLRELKIDRAFITHLDTSEADQIIVKSTIELAHSFGLRVIAEGVETSEAQAMLKELQCDYSQGYYLSRPLPAADVDVWMAEFEKQSNPAKLSNTIS